MTADRALELAVALCYAESRVSSRPAGEPMFIEAAQILDELRDAGKILDVLVGER